MTYEDALIWCKEFISNLPKDRRYYWTHNAMIVCMEALEKKMPKKPEEYCDGYADGYPVIEYKCPCCGRDIDDTEHHCVCGQTIDWSEEDEA